MDIVQFVLKNVNSTDYYKDRLPSYSGIKGTNISCIFPDKHSKGSDRTPSFSVDIGRAGGCYCHSCNTKIGSILHFEKLVEGAKTDEEAAKKIYSQFYRAIIEDDTIVDNFHCELIKNIRLLDRVKNDLGLTAATVSKFKLGFDEERNRITIPIYDVWGNLVNIRYYKLPSLRTKADKFKIYNHDGHGSPACLFYLPPVEKAEIVYWMTSERDVMLAKQMGISAVCTTGGENTWTEEHLETLRSFNCRVIIVPDNDKAGALAADKKIFDLQRFGLDSGIKKIPSEKDFSDWVLRVKATKSMFLDLPESLYDQAKKQVTVDVEVELIKGLEDYTQRKLQGYFEVADIGRKPSILNYSIALNGIISGKLDRTYAIPHIIKVGTKLLRLPISRELIAMIGMNDNHVDSFIRELLDAKKAKIEILEYLTCTEVEIIPVLVPGKEAIYATQRCFYIGEKIEVNMPYCFEVIPTTSIKSQETIGLIYNAIPLTNDLDYFSIENDEFANLIDKFVPDEKTVEGIYGKLIEIADELTNRWTLIFNREDLHIVQLLTWCCPLQFNFPCEGIQRGWLNTLVLGDTQTGKSEIANKLRNLFRAGSFISAENCTFVGLVGGAIKNSSGSFMLRWGKIPLYNRQLVVLEELSGLSTNDISNMSEVRSAGVARLDKGGLSGETSAKTRLLCMSNVRRKASNIDDYRIGVEAVQELIGQNEDVSRFDLILTVTDREVSNDIINRDRTKATTSLFSEQDRMLYEKLLHFIWALKPNQILITEEAYQEALEVTKRLAKMYHHNIPIFKSGSGRLKVARIACAIAALQFNWNEAKGMLIILPEHMLVAEQLLQMLYNKPSLGYLKYSKEQFYLENIVNEEELLAELDAKLKSKRSRTAFLRHLSFQGTFDTDELYHVTNLSSSTIDSIISALIASNVIRRASVMGKLIWRVTPTGKNWLSKYYSIDYETGTETVRPLQSKIKTLDRMGKHAE